MIPQHLKISRGGIRKREVGWGEGRGEREGRGEGERRGKCRKIKRSKKETMEGGRGGGKGEACFNPKVESIVQVSNLR